MEKLCLHRRAALGEVSLGMSDALFLIALYLIVLMIPGRAVATDFAHIITLILYCGILTLIAKMKLLTPFSLDRRTLYVEFEQLGST